MGKDVSILQTKKLFPFREMSMVYGEVMEAAYAGRVRLLMTICIGNGVGR
jgi:hypothetical protein